MYSHCDKKFAIQERNLSLWFKIASALRTIIQIIQQNLLSHSNYLTWHYNNDCVLIILKSIRVFKFKCRENYLIRSFTTSKSKRSIDYSVDLIMFESVFHWIICQSGCIDYFYKSPHENDFFWSYYNLKQFVFTKNYLFRCKKWNMTK